MTLTSDIKDSRSPIGGFFRKTFPQRHAREVLVEYRQEIDVPPIVRLGDNPHRGAYGQVGSAVDYRIRYHFAPTPLRKLAAAPGLLDVVYPERIQNDVSAGQLKVLQDSRLSPACADGFVEALESIVEETTAHRRAPTPAEESRLARFCLVMAALEAVTRALAWPPPWLGEQPPGDAEELLARVPDDLVEDAAALGTAFSERYASWRGSPDAVLNPTFAGSTDVGGADADFIVDGCLWDIKTTKVRGTKSVHLYQIIGYVLLDYEDEFGIDDVGLLLPRQNTRIRWPVEELITRMSGGTERDLASLRVRFRALLAEHPELSGDADR